MDKPINEEAFNRMVFEHQGLIWKVCHTFGHTAADREDLFQEIVIKLWQGLSSFRSESKMSTWLYRVALNAAISQRRKSMKFLRFKPADYPDEAPAEDHQDQREALYAAIRRLKKIERAVILLYLEELSYKEIAEITGLTEKNVSVKLVRIRAKLEKMVKSRINANKT